ncbi:uncharacterized protein LOC125507985 [Triticum urartu]|uniref:uncharacterized protein LOC125507985 n=1 Tax=Triticum urartu TaxID=4572 RepID=UPI00204451D1|nr:uncharacterized protein LOC125507985 [Triticum urartu]
MCQRERSACLKTRAPRASSISLAPEGVGADRRRRAWRRAGRRRDVSVRGHWSPLQSAAGSSVAQGPSRADALGGRATGPREAALVEPLRRGRPADASSDRGLLAGAWLRAADACAPVATGESPRDVSMPMPSGALCRERPLPCPAASRVERTREPLVGITTGPMSSLRRAGQGHGLERRRSAWMQDEGRLDHQGAALKEWSSPRYSLRRLRPWFSGSRREADRIAPPGAC